TAPGGGPVVGGVPLLRRGAEPLAQGRRPAGTRRCDVQGRNARQDRGGRAAGDDRYPGVPDPGADPEGQGLPRGQLGQGRRLSTTAARKDTAALEPWLRAPRGRGVARGRSLLGVVPFFAFVAVFLVIPTLVVVIGAFGGDDGRPTLANLSALTNGYIVDAFVRSIVLSALTAVLGAVFGALLAYALATAREGGLLRRVVTAA